ncbi:hypothetical protein B0H15DRAFT_839291, partial [Mycena belliarum]
MYVFLVVCCPLPLTSFPLSEGDGLGLRLAGAELSASSVRRTYTPALIAVRRGLGIRSRPRLSMVSIVLTCFYHAL